MLEELSNESLHPNWNYFSDSEEVSFKRAYFTYLLLLVKILPNAPTFCLTPLVIPLAWIIIIALDLSQKV